jgi:short-subunit dehydrogenase
LSSVAGDRGRQSNFIYGSSKAAFTAYLSGLRNYLFSKKVHVMTVKPGFMETKMTEGLPLIQINCETKTSSRIHLQSLQKTKKCSLCFANLEVNYAHHSAYSNLFLKN